jgi:thimet oligopeptidase
MNRWLITCIAMVFVAISCAAPQKTSKVETPKPPIPAPYWSVYQFNVDQNNLSSIHDVAMDLPYFELTAEEIEKNAKEAMRIATARYDKIAAINPNRATYDNTIAEMDRINYDVGIVAHRQGLLAETSLNKALRKKAKQMEVEFGKWGNAIEMRKDVYKVVKAYADTKPQLSGEDKRRFDKVMLYYSQLGFHLPEAKQKKVKKIKDTLTVLKKKIRDNISKANKKRVVLTARELKGTPKSTLKMLTKNANGTYSFPIGVRNIVWDIFTNCPNERTRKKVFTAWYSRAKNNKRLMTQVFELRAQMAHLLGYQTWADLQIEDKMAQKARRAIDFEDKLIKGLQPKFEKELAALTAIKAKETGNKNAKINAWDKEYYTRKFEKAEFSLDMDSLKKYFEYYQVLNGMFRVYEGVFSINIEKIKAPYVWHPKVDLIKISDKQTGRPMGFVYLDMFPRPDDEKYGHFAMFTVRPGKRLDSGIYRRPVAALVCNFPEPKGNEPALMSYDNVNTLFHEFGHALHGVLTETKYQSLAGTRVPGDFVETPSQVLEYWLRDKRVLDLFAANHKDPNDKIPQSVIDKIKKAEVASVGMFYRRQLAFGKMDLNFHTLKHGTKLTDIVRSSNKVLKDVYIEFPKGSSFITGFGHLFGGYDAGYYGYAWADTIAADIASKFEESDKGYMDPDLGLKLRRTIFETGNSRDPNESIREFLGRDTNLEAFLRNLGIGKG